MKKECSDNKVVTVSSNKQCFQHDVCDLRHSISNMCAFVDPPVVNIAWNLLSKIHITLQELKLQGIKICVGVAFSRYSRVKFFGNDLSIFCAPVQVAV